MKKIVVLFGSFNPVTKAHFSILADSIDKVGADEGVFVATNNKYLTKKNHLKVKTPTNFILSEQTRAEMLQSLNNENKKISFWGFERGGDSPNTLKTLKTLLKDKQKQYKEEIQLLYICGADKLKELSHWRDCDEMIKLFEYLVYCRSGIDVDGIINKNAFLLEHRNRIHVVMSQNDDIEEVSSTEVRRRFFHNEDYKELMNDGPYTILNRFKVSDFPAVSSQDIIESQFLYGGMFGKIAARKMIFKENNKMFNNWDESYLGNREEHYESKVYRSITNTSMDGPNYQTQIKCFNKTIDCVAEELVNEDLKPVIVNISSKNTPCGKYNEGDVNGEEYLSRISTLSASLYRYGDMKKKYIREMGLENVPGVYPLNIGSMGIYSGCVTFFRGDENKHYLIRQSTFDCPVITVASIVNDGLSSIYFDSNGCFTSEGKLIEKNMVRTALRIALVNGRDSVVFSDLGCKECNLNIDEVVHLLQEVLTEQEFVHRFKKIVFTIDEGKPSARKGPIEQNGKYASFYKFFN